jgi:hypothetical protein
MMSIFGCTFVFSNCVLDLCENNDREAFVSGIRQEYSRCLNESSGRWTKASMGKLDRADSTLRESMRLSSHSVLDLFREVAPGDGLKLGHGDNVD